MALATYTELLDAVQSYADRDDLAAVFPVFLDKVEATLNRRLSDPDQEVRATHVATSDYSALPADFGEMVSITTGEGPLQAMGPAEYAGIDSTFVGTPRFYTISDGEIAFYPRNSTANIEIVYRRRIPPLTEASPTNWLLSRAPDIYFNGAMFEQAAWNGDRDTARDWKALFEQAVGEMLTDGARRRWGAGPLAPRIRRT